MPPPTDDGHTGGDGLLHVTAAPDLLLVSARLPPPGEREGWLLPAMQTVDRSLGAAARLLHGAEHDDFSFFLETGADEWRRWEAQLATALQRGAQAALAALAANWAVPGRMPFLAVAARSFDNGSGDIIAHRYDDDPAVPAGWHTVRETLDITTGTPTDSGARRARAETFVHRPLDRVDNALDRATCRRHAGRVVRTTCLQWYDLCTDTGELPQPDSLREHGNVPLIAENLAIALAALMPGLPQGHGIDAVH